MSEKVLKERQLVFLHMMHHATAHIMRERYTIPRKKILNNFLKIFFTTAVVPFTGNVNRGVMLRII